MNASWARWLSIGVSISFGFACFAASSLAQGLEVVRSNPQVFARSSGLSAPRQLSPKDSTIQSPNNLTLTWRAVRGAAYYQVAIKIGSQGKWRASKLLRTTGAKITSDAYGSVFYWKVRAIKKNKRDKSKWSPTRLFLLNQACVTRISPNQLTVAANPKKTPFSDTQDYNVVVETSGDCKWEFSLPPDWISFPDGRSGQGTDVVKVSVSDNTTFTGRFASIDIEGLKLAVSQSYGELINVWQFEINCNRVISAPVMEFRSDGRVILNGVDSGAWFSSIGAVSFDVQMSGMTRSFGGTAYNALLMAGAVNCADGSTGSWTATAN